MKKNKIKLLLLILPLSLILTGCGQVSVNNNGIWNLIVISFAQAIAFLGGILGDNIGLGIIAMTIITRIILLPLYAKQIKSSEQMKKIQPKINSLNKKYEGKKDAENQRKKALEQQAIYKEAQINPLAGCLPMLIQLPLLIAFYNAIQYLVPAQATIDQITKEGGTVIYGMQELGIENYSTTIFGFDLGNPVIIFAILAAVTTFLTTYVTMIGQDQTAPGAGAMKGMMYFMPIMILFIGMTLPGALSIYWLIGNLLSIGQTLYFKRSDLQTMRQKTKIEK